jgi:hypothetical protein
VIEYSATSNASIGGPSGFWWDKPLEGTPQYALLQIGEPCAPALVETIAESDSANTRGACLQVLVQLHDWAEVAALLHNATVKERDQVRVRRLKEALATLGEMPPEGQMPPYIQGMFEHLPNKPGER